MSGCPHGRIKRRHCSTCAEEDEARKSPAPRSSPGSAVEWLIGGYSHHDGNCTPIPDCHCGYEKARDAALAELASLCAENSAQAKLLERAESIIHVAPVLGAAKWIEDYHASAPVPAAKPRGPFLCIECKRAPVTEDGEMCDLCDQESADHEFP